MLVPRESRASLGSAFALFSGSPPCNLKSAFIITPDPPWNGGLGCSNTEHHSSRYARSGLWPPTLCMCHILLQNEELRDLVTSLGDMPKCKSWKSWKRQTPWSLPSRPTYCHSSGTMPGMNLIASTTNSNTVTYYTLSLSLNPNARLQKDTKW